MNHDLVRPAYDPFTSGMRGAMVVAGAMVLLAAVATYLGCRRQAIASEAPAPV